MSKGKKDLMAGCVLVVFSAVYFALSFQIKLTSIDRIVGSRMFPQILGVCMFLLGICLIVGGIAAMKRERKASATQAEHQEATENVDSRVAAMMKNAEEAGEEALKAKDTKNVIWKTIGVFGSFALYIVLLDKIGFTIASTLYLFSQMIMMAKEPIPKKNYVVYAIISVVTAVVLYLMFVKGFKLILPQAGWF